MGEASGGIVRCAGMSSSVRDRVATAPISWGVSEVPGWGYQLPVERVLAEMRALGLAATEFGPPGFLPTAAADRAAVLSTYGMRAVGGFLALVLHDEDTDPVAAVHAELDAFAAAGADSLVLAADTGGDGYDTGGVLTAGEWRRLLTRLDAISARAADRGITATLHPHVGTLVEGPAEVERVLDGSSIALCLDTGHLLVGGVAPAELARQASSRVAHVHLKDVDARLADGVRGGTIGYAAAVRQGLFAPLGAGAVDVRGVLDGLAATSYAGWYVLEQDSALDAEPEPAGGPQRDVAASLRCLDELVGARA